MTRILCVDDEAALLHSLTTFLDDLGYDVIEAETGDEGLSAILNERPALVICDRMMPGMSGTEMLRVLRQDHPEHALMPFIFLTALGDPRDVHATADLHPAAYLTKPVKFDELQQKISQILT